MTVAAGVATNVVSNSSPTTLGSSITFTATLCGGGALPTGTVAWTVSGSGGATACATSTTSLVAGIATCTITASKAGSYVVSDNYGGDGNYGSVASAPTPSPSRPGSRRTWSATPARRRSARASPSPRRSRRGRDPDRHRRLDRLGLGGATACATSTTSLVAGIATCTITASKAGSYVVSDNYGGDGNYGSVASTPTP